MTIEVTEHTITGSRAEVLAKMLKALSGDGGTAKIDPDILMHRLRDHAAEFHRESEFKPGDFVRLKPGFDFYKFPQPGDMCVVIGLIDPPIRHSRDAPEQGALLNLRLGMLYDGKFVMGGFEGKLFEPWPTNGNQNTQP